MMPHTFLQKVADVTLLAGTDDMPATCIVQLHWRKRSKRDLIT